MKALQSTLLPATALHAVLCLGFLTCCACPFLTAPLFVFISNIWWTEPHLSLRPSHQLLVPVCRHALLSCRAVYVAIPVCVAGVILITQPAFLGQSSQQRSKLGIMLAVGQVGLCLHVTSLYKMSYHTITRMLLVCTVHKYTCCCAYASAPLHVSTSDVMLQMLHVPGLY